MKTFDAGSSPAGLFMKKICSKCDIEKELSEFHKDSSRKDSLRSDCKKCQCLRAQKYRNTDVGKKEIAKSKKRYGRSKKGKATIRAHDKKHKKDNPEKIKAYDAVKYALGTSKLKKKPCHCGATRIEGHHKDYNKPLEVEWLCSKHHKELHRKVRNE